MKLILARIVFNFDMKLADDSKNWMRGQKVLTFWDKPPLNVYYTKVQR